MSCTLLDASKQPNGSNQSVDAHRGEYLRFDHVIVGGVEDVASDDPHDVLVNHGLMGGPGQPSFSVLLPTPEGGVGRD